MVKSNRDDLNELSSHTYIMLRFIQIRVLDKIIVIHAFFIRICFVQVQYTPDNSNLQGTDENGSN